MARRARLTTHGEQIVEAFDLDESGYRHTPSMATKDGSPPDCPIPLFLSDQAEEPEQPGIGKAWDRAVISSRILKTSVLFVTAAPIFFPVLLVENPTALFANATASLAGTLAPQDGTRQSMPTIQSTAGAQALAPTAREAPTRDKI